MNLNKFYFAQKIIFFKGDSSTHLDYESNPIVVLSVQNSKFESNVNGVQEFLIKKLVRSRFKDLFKIWSTAYVRKWENYAQN